MHGSLSLRARLLVVLAVALLPIAALIAWSNVRSATAAADDTRTQLKFAASLLAAHENRAVDAAEQLLGAIASMPQLRTLPQPQCQRYFERLHAEFPAYANLALFDPQGQVVCDALRSRGLQVLDRDYFRETLARRAFVMGEPIVGRITHRPSLPFALPVIEEGRVVAVAYAALDLVRASDNLSQVDVPPGARVSVADRHGHILMESPRRPGRELLRVSVQPELLEAAREMRAIAGEARDSAGELRMYSIAPGRSVAGDGLLVRVSLPREAAWMGAWVRLRQELALLAVVMLAVLAAIWWMGGRMIVKPARQILGTLHSLEHGQLEARVPVQTTGELGEFARIGAAFNAMADSLQTHQAELETRIAERTEQLRASNQELEAFSYSVSHDLRAPLAAISGFSSALQDRIGSEGDTRSLHYLARIQAGVRKMEELIEALLQLSRVVRAQLEWRDVDLSQLARETIEGLQQQHPGRRVQVHVEDGLVARGDPQLLHIVLENLVGNAWKFTAQREDASIEVGRTDGNVFFVRDNGVGFDMAYAAKLFTAFQRLHTESEFPGTGIGLATVRRAILRHQGRVWAQSQPGTGTTFYFTL
ncbi:MAG TPA: ATP-binding protein [Ramlibacter sp.]